MITMNNPELILDEAIRILIYFVLAGLIASSSKFLARQIMNIGRIVIRKRRPSLERQTTWRSLVSNAIRLVIYLIAILASLGLFIEPDTIAWIVGLFSAAFGLGAHSLIRDYLAGLSYIFEDTFTIGEKIELPGLTKVGGVIEAINLRSTSIRAPSGELYVVPNGEVRIVRNFSRGKFSLTKITLKISTQDLGNALAILEELGKEAVVLLPNLIEPWQVISPEGVIGQCTELSLIAKARFGNAAEMRPRLLNLVQERLTEAGVGLST
jgi:small conductance mechanosensitive channel